MRVYAVAMVMDVPAVAMTILSKTHSTQNGKIQNPPLSSNDSYLFLIQCRSNSKLCCVAATECTAHQVSMTARRPKKTAELFSVLRELRVSPSIHPHIKVPSPSALG